MFLHQIIEATTTTEDSKPAFEAEFSPDLTHPNVVQTFKASSVPITVRLRILKPKPQAMPGVTV